VRTGGVGVGGVLGGHAEGAAKLDQFHELVSAAD
jgi:hypothetical protein